MRVSLHINLLPIFMLIWTTNASNTISISGDKQEAQKLKAQESKCDAYNYCGIYGICDPDKPPFCTCLRGFRPRNTEEWNRQNWTSGCVRRALMKCEINGSDWFWKVDRIRVPDSSKASFVSEDSCRIQCLRSCSCVAYAYAVGMGCMTWTGNLSDIVRLSGGGVDLYLREAKSELDKRKKNLKVVIIVSVTVGVIILTVCAYILWARTARHHAKREERKRALLMNTLLEDQIGDLKTSEFEKMPLYDFRIIAAATNNFNFANKLGQGGFGSVYKGQLHDGQEIAVKRLSKASRQGLKEFMNEVVVISKLQHRNLVRLLGCCIEGEEKMLIYEYMPNNSLDVFLFDPIKKKVLDWKKRFNIIEGISRGLLYLHRDSRLKIIHRDLKPGNILLDGELNPKISDFGLAKIFGRSEDEGNTRRVVGTYGYMSPEYAMEGLFSEKSDVFSFGVLLLEIISGRKNTRFCDHEHSLGLLGFAWKLWNEENIESMIEPEICNPDYVSEIIRCIHIGLLCVQEHARDRPSMGTVISMLNNEIVNLAPPSQPAFIQRQVVSRAESSQQSNNRSSSINNVTLTDMQAR